MVECRCTFQAGTSANYGEGFQPRADGTWVHTRCGGTIAVEAMPIGFRELAGEIRVGPDEIIKVTSSVDNTVMALLGIELLLVRAHRAAVEHNQPIVAEKISDAIVRTRERLVAEAVHKRSGVALWGQT